MMKGLGHLKPGKEIIMKGLETDNQKIYTPISLAKAFFDGEWENEMLKSSLTFVSLSKKPPQATDEKD